MDRSFAQTGVGQNSGAGHDVPRPISDHGVVGDMNTLAMVARDGAIDFLCWPFFDSPTIFASLLDTETGGGFDLAPDIAAARTIQMYIPESNVLMTRWLGEHQSAEVYDFMPVGREAGHSRFVRQISVTRGEVEIDMRCWPRDDYARNTPAVTLDGGTAIFKCRDFTLRLRSSIDLAPAPGEASARFRLKAGEKAWFVLDCADDVIAEDEDLELERRATVAYWQRWAKRSNYTGRWRSAVTRSALALKLLTSAKYGSIAAAGTFGLPEAPGGERNWDYRATWIRDASFTVYAFIRLGYQEEAEGFMRWLGNLTYRSGDPRLEIMYRLDGALMENEISLPNLRGYGGAQPVRVGNDAVDQIQLDIYGGLMDALYLTNKYGEAIPHAGWKAVRQLVDTVGEVWRQPDAGIWESRAEPQEHLHSRVMCWVAVDRAMRLAEKRSLPAPLERWLQLRNEIAEDIWHSFWNDELGHFVQAKGGTDVDASMLMMPLVRFVSATDPAWLATLDAISKQLADDSFVRRYKVEDGLTGQEGFFAACSFWHVECLARAGRLDEAQMNMEKLILMGNHVQLYAEEFGPRGEFLGNFPQALTHLALISAACYLDRALDGKFTTWRP